MLTTTGKCEASCHCVVWLDREHGQCMASWGQLQLLTCSSRLSRGSSSKSLSTCWSSWPGMTVARGNGPGKPTTMERGSELPEKWTPGRDMRKQSVWQETRSQSLLEDRATLQWAANSSAIHLWPNFLWCLGLGLEATRGCYREAAMGKPFMNRVCREGGSSSHSTDPGDCKAGG